MFMFTGQVTVGILILKHSCNADKKTYKNIMWKLQCPEKIQSRKDKLEITGVTFCVFDLFSLTPLNIKYNDLIHINIIN